MKGSAPWMASNPDFVLVGPLVWQASDGKTRKRWYFMLVTGQEAAPDFTITEVHVGDERDEELRLFVRGQSVFPGVVIVDCDSERTLAEYTVSLWPNDRAKKILAETP